MTLTKHIDGDAFIDSGLNDISLPKNHHSTDVQSFHSNIRHGDIAVVNHCGPRLTKMTVCAKNVDQ